MKRLSFTLVLGTIAATYPREPGRGLLSAQPPLIPRTLESRSGITRPPAGIRPLQRGRVGVDHRTPAPFINDRLTPEKELPCWIRQDD